MSDIIAPTKPAAAESASASSVATVALMDQLAAPSIRAESPLFHADLATVAKQGPKTGGVTLQEHKLLGHLVIRGSQDNAAFLAGARAVLGVDLPTQPLTSAEAGTLSVRWIAPDEWLVILPGLEAFELENRLREAMSGHIAIVNVSGGQTVLELSGADARAVLKKSTPYDVHDRNFPVGKVVTTVFAKSQAVIRRTGEQSWELVIRRSFADYLWLWLQDACAEFGLVVKD
ncbi:sarcosine oxidase subunit gamma [Marinobacterium rhizophilum]|uniref:Sarcosine oxidase subunit gamma family protein n=1 Tax=Marinobacterium rhizophilum TaxID=420402 RepID=A0ABY5HG31_9GAMM|nr:sarcosine oxidase subunit gamma family protein [Marinobacterium rhizophilum]UTW10264.1 sarcosine oxidase subunit gamma family protein [Marinobacterium rhizophilum]